MAIAYVQSTIKDVASGTSSTKAYTGSVAAGSLLVLGARVGANGRTITVSDDKNGVWVQARTQIQATDGHQAYIYYRSAAAAGTTTVTFAISGAAASMRWAQAEYTLADTLDQVNSASLDDTSPVDSGNVVTTVAAELLFGLGTDANNFGDTWGAASSGGTWTIREVVGTNSCVMIDDLTVAGTGTYKHDPTASTPNNFTSLVATFYQAASGAYLKAGYGVIG